MDSFVSQKSRSLDLQTSDCYVIDPNRRCKASNRPGISKDILSGKLRNNENEVAVPLQASLLIHVGSQIS